MGCQAFFEHLTKKEYIPGDDSTPFNRHLEICPICTFQKIVTLKLKALKIDISKYPNTNPLDLIPKNHYLLSISHDPKRQQPLFREQMGSILQQRFTHKAKIDIHFTCYNFRRRAASHALLKCASENLIKALGRWNNDCYRAYLKFTPLDLTRLSQCMANLENFQNNRLNNLSL